MTQISGNWRINVNGSAGILTIEAPDNINVTGKMTLSDVHRTDLIDGRWDDAAGKLTMTRRLPGGATQSFSGAIGDTVATRLIIGGSFTESDIPPGSVRSVFGWAALAPYRIGQSPVWSNEENLGSLLTLNPGCASWAAGRLDVFYRGQNSHLWHRWFDGAWHNEEDLGGVLTSGPACSSWAAGRLDVFYRGQNSHLWHRWFDGTWSAEEDLGSTLMDACGACSWAPDRLDVFFPAQDSTLRHRWYPVQP